ncbi:MAG: winged helix-turn-helix transcriptional regulator, partial [Candidatus Dormibacteraeota bacterium]|nr:winged helix-turn-helix transcriptional regulator [Candidatus Dormibacteraeota bacterium]
ISVLSAVCDKPGIGIADLAAREGTSAPSISGHVDRLEAAGLLERRREESGDRRRIGLHVTAEGTRVLRDVRSRRTAWLASRLEALPPAERRRVAEAVEALGALVAP